MASRATPGVTPGKWAGSNINFGDPILGRKIKLSQLSIPAQPRWYGGIYHRATSDARRSCMFDHMPQDWEYEAEESIFHRGTRYLPDDLLTFHMPPQDDLAPEFRHPRMWVQIKGCRPDQFDLEPEFEFVENEQLPLILDLGIRLPKPKMDEVVLYPALLPCWPGLVIHAISYWPHTYYDHGPLDGVAEQMVHDHQTGLCMPLRRLFADNHRALELRQINSAIHTARNWHFPPDSPPDRGQPTLPIPPSRPLLYGYAWPDS